MARRRMIDPNFWESEDVARLSVLGRLLLLGMISNADDEGRGRANVHYLRAKVFPYDGIAQKEMERALLEIKQNISVTVYRVGRNEYYAFLHWRNWQRVDKPQRSVIPPPKGHMREDSANDSKDGSGNGSGAKEKKGKEEKEREGFIAPTREEVAAYCRERGSIVDAQYFMDYQEARGWVLSNGGRMKDWRAAVRSWERFSKDDRKSFAQHTYSEQEKKRQEMAALKQLEELDT